MFLVEDMFAEIEKVMKVHTRFWVFSLVDNPQSSAIFQGGPLGNHEKVQKRRPAGGPVVKRSEDPGGRAQEKPQEAAGKALPLPSHLWVCSIKIPPREDCPGDFGKPGGILLPSFSHIVCPLVADTPGWKGAEQGQHSDQ